MHNLPGGGRVREKRGVSGEREREREREERKERRKKGKRKKEREREREREQGKEKRDVRRVSSAPTSTGTHGKQDGLPRINPHRTTCHPPRDTILPSNLLVG